MTDTSMWDTADEITRERTKMAQRLVEAAVEPLWPFLAEASTPAEFEHRLAMSQEGLARSAAFIPDVAGLPDLPTSTLAAHGAQRLRERFTAQHTASETTRALEASLRAAVATTAAKEDFDGDASKVYIFNGKSEFYSGIKTGDRVHIVDWSYGEGRVTVTKADESSAQLVVSKSDLTPVSQAKVAATTEWEQDPGGLQTVPDGTLAAVEGYPVDLTYYDRYGDSVSISGRISDWAKGYDGDVEIVTETGTEIVSKERIERIVKHPQGAPADPGQMPLFAKRKTAGWIDTARGVVDNHQHAEIGGKGGVILDATTAAMLVQIHDALNEANRAKFAAMPLEQAVTMGWKLVERKTGSRRTARLHTASDYSQAKERMRMMSDSELQQVIDDMDDDDWGTPADLEAEVAMDMLVERGVREASRHTAGYMGPADEEGFVTVFGPYEGRAVVRTTNGGEVEGHIDTRGSTFAIDVQRPDGSWFPIMGWRVLSIKPLEQATTASKTAANYDAIQQAVRKGMMMGSFEHVNEGAMLPSMVYTVMEPGPNGARPTDRKTSDMDEAGRWAEDLLKRTDWKPYTSSMGPAVTALLVEAGDWRVSTCKNCGGQIEEWGGYGTDDWRHTEGDAEGDIDCPDGDGEAEPSDFLGSKREAALEVCPECKGDTSTECAACGGKGVKTSAKQAAEETHPYPDMGDYRVISQVVTQFCREGLFKTYAEAEEAIGDRLHVDGIQHNLTTVQKVEEVRREFGGKTSAVQALLDHEAAFFHAPQAPNAPTLPYPKDTAAAGVRERGMAETERLRRREQQQVIDEQESRKPKQAESSRHVAEDIQTRLDGLAQSDDFGGAPTTPMSTRPRVVPSGGSTPMEGDEMLVPNQQADNPDFAPVDPMRPTVGQKVQARIARLATRIKADNPTMSDVAVRSLALRTVRTYPEMLED